MQRSSGNGCPGTACAPLPWSCPCCHCSWILVSQDCLMTAPASPARLPVPAALLCGSIQEVADQLDINQAFLGLIVLPIAGNVVEHLSVGGGGGGVRWIHGPPGQAVRSMLHVAGCA